jgi:NAD(P)H-hydrate epimerase
MATAGSGDVLTGVITALLAQGYSSEEACKIGVFVHGLAGDIAKRKLGEISMTAGDIVRYLPAAFKAVAE